MLLSKLDKGINVGHVFTREETGVVKVVDLLVVDKVLELVLDPSVVMVVGEWVLKTNEHSDWYLVHL